MVGFDEFRALRYSKEDVSPLWRRGLDSVVLLDQETLSVRAEYPNFWTPGYTPMFLNISEVNKRVYGYSMSHEDSIFTILAVQDDETHAKSLNVPPEHKWAGMELTTDHSLMVIANACKKTPKSRNYNPHDEKKNEYVRIMAVDLTGDKIKTVCYKDFNSENFSAVQFMRKVKGYDFFMLACKGSIAILELRDAEKLSRGPASGHRSSKERNKEFSILRFIENLYENYIFEIAIFGDWIVPVSLGGETDQLKLIRFGDRGSKRLTKRGIEGGRSGGFSVGESKFSEESDIRSSSINTVQRESQNPMLVFSMDPVINKISTPNLSKF